MPCRSASQCSSSARCRRFVARRSPSRNSSSRTSTSWRFEERAQHAHEPGFVPFAVRFAKAFDHLFPAASRQRAARAALRRCNPSSRSRAPHRSGLRGPGSAIAARTRSSSSASRVAKTLAEPRWTLATPSFASASRTAAPCRWLRTSTAMSPPRRRRVLPAPSSMRAASRAPRSSSRAISATVASRAIRVAAALLSALPSSPAHEPDLERRRPLRRRSRSARDSPGAACDALKPISSMRTDCGACSKMRFTAVSERRRRAPVHVQRMRGRASRARADVGVDVGAAEAVDRLLRDRRRGTPGISNPA